MSIKSKVCVLALAAMWIGAVAQDAEKVETSEERSWLPSLEISIDHTSKYMSEGFVGNPDPIDTIGVTLGYDITDSLSVHVSGTAIIDETDACGNRHDVEEWDWAAGVTWTTPELGKLGKLELTLDHIYYNYPHDGAHTHDVDTKEYEIDVNAVDVFLSPGIVFVHDYENDVIKANVNVTFEYDLEKILENLSFECPLEIWFGNHRYTGCTSHSAVYSICIQPTLTYAINDNISIGTYVQMGYGLDSRVRRAWKADGDNNVFNACWGVNLGVEF